MPLPLSSPNASSKEKKGNTSKQTAKQATYERRKRKENSRPKRSHSDNKRTTRSKKYSAPQKQYENRVRFPHGIEILHLLGVKTTR